MRSTVALLAIAVFALSACADDKKAAETSAAPPDQLDTAAMVPAIQTVLDLAATDPVDEARDVSACPLGDFDALAAKAPAEVLASLSQDGALDAYVYQPVGDPPHLQCGRGDLGAYTGLRTDEDYHDLLIRVLPDFIVTFGDDVPHLSGTIVPFCAEPIGVDSGSDSFCGADWYNDEVWIGVFIYGPAASSEAAQLWLTTVLGDIAADVPQVAPTVELAS